MELNNSINLNLEKNINKEDFLNSTLWKTINNGIDIGLRYALPDFVEDEIIDLKNNLINFGLKDRNKKINRFYNRNRKTNIRYCNRKF